MKRRWGIRLVLAALAFWLAWRAWRLVEGDPILMLLFFIVSGAVVALVFVKVVLARMADAIGNAVFLSGGPQTPEDVETNNEDEEDAAAGEAKVEEAKTETP
jgi:type VI protein secretion system component VasK